MIVAVGSVVLGLACGLASDDALTTARQAWADGFLDGPKVHLELAKVHYNAGRLELAQRICEETRHRFGDGEFDGVYRDVFVFQPTPEPEAELAENLKQVTKELEDGNADVAKVLADGWLVRWPRSSELNFYLGRAKDMLGEPADAQFAEAVELAPTSPFIQGWTARRHLKQKDDSEAAFEGYLRTYFLDPHFYDTEFAESRIGDDLGPKRSYAVYVEARDKGDFRTVLSMDRYWGTDRGVQKLNKDWRPEFAEDAVRLLAHDSSEVRWNAMLLLQEKADDAFDPKIDELLADADPRVKGLAIYLAVSRRGDAAIPAARAHLESDCALLRFDAISALARHGGEVGTALLAEQATREEHPALKKMLEKHAR